MAIQNINTDLLPRARAAVEALEECGYKKLQAGIDEALEIAKESGSQKLIGNVTNFHESSVEVIKAMKDVQEVLEKLITEYAKLEDVL